MTKKELIDALIGKKFLINGKECFMQGMTGTSKQVWVVKNSWWKENVIAANRLTNAELPFYNLYTEVLEKHFNEDEVPYEDAKKIASELVAYLNEVSQIVDFFNKPDEIRRLKRKINDLILQTDHSDPVSYTHLTLPTKA